MLCCHSIPNEQILKYNLYPSGAIAHKLWWAVWLSHATAVVQMCLNKGMDLGGRNGAGEEKADEKDSKVGKSPIDHRNGISTGYRMVGLGRGEYEEVEKLFGVTLGRQSFF